MAEESNIQVVVRLRPMSERELKGNTLPVVTASTEKKEICVIKGAGARTLRNTFAFDNVFTSFSTQREVFEQTLAPVIGDVLSGYESTVFAYGQTGTGKTHTMEGVITDAELRGVIPRAAFDVFRRLSDDSYVEHAVSASFLEIYNEEMCDLLLDCDLDDVATVKARSKELRLVEDPSKKKGRGVFVMNLTEEPVNSPEDVLALMQRAAARRQVGETKMNKQSSRSHCVFTMNVSSKRRLPDGSTMECSGKLHMVDLAGSECAKSAGGSDLDPSRERERKNINQSLLTLGRVITLLKAGGKAKGERIPYATPSSPACSRSPSAGDARRASSPPSPRPSCPSTRPSPRSSTRSPRTASSTNPPRAPCSNSTSTAPRARAPRRARSTANRNKTGPRWSVACTTSRHRRRKPPPRSRGNTPNWRESSNAPNARRIARKPPKTSPRDSNATSSR